MDGCCPDGVWRTLRLPSFCIQWMLLLWLPLPKRSNTPGASTPMLWPVQLDLCFRIGSTLSNKSSCSEQTKLHVMLHLKCFKRLRISELFLMCCYPLQQRTHVQARTSPVRTASACQPGGAAMASQSALTVLTRLMQPAVSVVAMKMHNYRWMCVEVNEHSVAVWEDANCIHSTMPPFVLQIQQAVVSTRLMTSVRPPKEGTRWLFVIYTDQNW